MYSKLHGAWMSPNQQQNDAYQLLFSFAGSLVCHTSLSFLWYALDAKKKKKKMGGGGGGGDEDEGRPHFVPVRVPQHTTSCWIGKS